MAAATVVPVPAEPAAAPAPPSESAWILAVEVAESVTPPEATTLEFWIYVRID